MRHVLKHPFRALGGFALLAGLFLGLATPAQAFPIFARKYQTSCVTCHTVYPKLNAFGEAFRLNGYRMPKETEEQIKQKPVSLGSEAYKRVWPSAVWPNELPGNAPLAVNVKMASVYNAATDASGNKTVVHNDFQFPQEVNLFAAGTLGEHMSFMAELTHAENSDGSAGTEIEHARLDFDSILGPEHAFNIRIGKFAPNLYDGFQEMWIMTDNGVDSMFNYNPVGYRGGVGILDDAAGVVSLPARARAIEAYGVIGHRFFYTFGAMSKIAPGANSSVSGSSALNSTGTANGNYNNSTHKDLYLRMDYKFGGMGLDGDTEGVTLPPENWRENSLRVGVFGLKGNATSVDFLAADINGLVIDPVHLVHELLRRRDGVLVFAAEHTAARVEHQHGTDRLQAAGVRRVEGAQLPRQLESAPARIGTTLGEPQQGVYASEGDQRPERIARRHQPARCQVRGRLHCESLSGFLLINVVVQSLSFPIHTSRPHRAPR